ncbi:MAG TPA: SPOR domain-containing protein [Bacteroidota bacterium]|nr:SPOR domain-containing protein [Bacteroidota bacterium]
MQAIKKAFAASLVLTALLVGCSASDEATRKTEQSADTLSIRASDTRLTTDQDTVVASVTTQSKTSTRSAIDSTIAPGLAFTVQVGAFAEPKNALRAQQVAKDHFGHYPVFNQFEASLKLYRVSIGKFESREEALELLKEVRKVLPKEYTECWINTIAK